MSQKFRSSLTAPIGDKNYLQKRVPKNPNFRGVKASVRSGAHAKNQKVKLDTRHENFKRITRTTLGRLIKQADEEEESVYDYRASDTLSEYSLATTTDFTGTEVMLLDTRDPDEFRAGHIDGAVNFPLPLLRRDAFTKEIHMFKNRPNRLIVVYHFEENKHGATAATLFNEKQYANVRLLTGGFTSFAAKFPARVAGALPVPPTPTSGRAPLSSRNGSRPASGLRRDMKSSRVGTPGMPRGTMGSRPGSRPGSGRQSVKSMRQEDRERDSGSVFRQTGRRTMTSSKAWR